jgi:hypothetical protein
MRRWLVCPLTVRPNAAKSRAVTASWCKYFGCRVCHDLTYTSSQENPKYDSAFALMAKNFPGRTRGEIKRRLEGNGKNARRFVKWEPNCRRESLRTNRREEVSRRETKRVFSARAVRRSITSRGLNLPYTLKLICVQINKRIIHL